MLDRNKPRPQHPEIQGHALYQSYAATRVDDTIFQHPRESLVRYAVRKSLCLPHLGAAEGYTKILTLHVQTTSLEGVGTASFGGIGSRAVESCAFCDDESFLICASSSRIRAL